MDSKSRGIVVLSLVLIALSWALLQGPGDASDDLGPLWRFSAGDVARVEITRAEDELVLARGEGGWAMSAPFSEPRVDQRRVEQLLLALAELRIEEVVEVSGDSGEPFGLGDPPKAHVRITLESGRGEELAVGARTPVGFGTYARDDQGRIVAIRGDLDRELQADAEVFRDHRVLSFDAGSVRSVEIDGPDGVLRMHGQGTRWWLDDHGVADPDRVDDLVMGLLDIRFDDLLDLSDELAEPRRTATVRMADGTSHVLRVGEATPLGILVWASDGRRGVVRDDALSLLAQGPSDVGIQHAFGVDLDRSERIEASLGDARVVLVRTSDHWTAEGYERSEALALVRALSEVGVVYDLVRSDPVDEPWGRVEVHTNGVSRTVTLSSTRAGVHSAQDAEGGAPYRVPAADLRAVLDRIE